MEIRSGEFSGKLNFKRKRNDKETYESKRKTDRQDKICRDFLRNVCDRGAACKFDHPTSSKKEFVFCHDFQNGYCRRSKNCRFIHSSTEDEKFYNKTGRLPPHLLNWFDNQARCPSNDGDVIYCKKLFMNDCWDEDCGHQHVAPNEYQIREVHSPSPLDKPQRENLFEHQTVSYCKDYLWNGCCTNDCRFKHNSRNEYRKTEGRSPTPFNTLSCANGVQQRSLYEFENQNNFRDGDVYELEVSRNFIPDNEHIEKVNINTYETSVQYQSRAKPERSYIMLEEENIMLRERISKLKKRIDDLQVTNEFLLEQNARLRLQQEKNAGLTTMTVPAVTINSVPGANQMQQNPTPQQMVTAALRTVTASVTTVPVSLGTVTPVSLAAVSMAPVQQIPGSVMTIAQQSAPPSEAQIAPQPLSIPSVPLVSYPIMSRTVMQTSAPPPPSLRH